MTILLIRVIWTLTVLGSIMANAWTQMGHVGGEVQIRCSHEFARNNVKYFCNRTCETEKDILIKSKKTHKPTKKGRYSLVDEGLGVFVVTISKLKKSDSGTYWCGVDRFLKDTYHEVILTVLDAPLPTSHPTPRVSDWHTTEETEKRETTDSETTMRIRATSTTAAANAPENREMVYIGAGLAVLVLLFIIFLFILIKQSKQKKTAKQKNEKAEPHWSKETDYNPHVDPRKSSRTNQTKTSTAKTSSSANQKTASDYPNTSKANRRHPPDPDSTVYSNITSHPQDSLNYATLDFAGQSDDLHYSNIIFVRESDATACHPTKSPVDTDGSSHPAGDASAVIYSAIRNAK